MSFHPAAEARIKESLTYTRFKPFWAGFFDALKNTKILKVKATSTGSQVNFTLDWQIPSQVTVRVNDFNEIPQACYANGPSSVTQAVLEVWDNHFEEDYDFKHLQEFINQDKDPQMVYWWWTMGVGHDPVMEQARKLGITVLDEMIQIMSDPKWVIQSKKHVESKVSKQLRKAIQEALKANLSAEAISRILKEEIVRETMEA